MTTKTNIINQALVMLGEGPQPEYPCETTDDRAYKIMLQEYDQAKLEVLRMYEWNIALRTEAVARLENDWLADTEVEHPSFDFRHTWPDCCVRLIDVVEGSGGGG